MIEIPKNCPSCNSPLETVNDQLFCRGTECPAQTLKRLQHFAKVVKIKGMGEKTLEKLDFDDISDIYTFSESYYVDNLGETIGRKLYKEVKNSTSTELGVALAAFSIPLIGETAAQKIASVVSSVTEITEETCKEAGLGPKATANLMDWLAYEEYKSVPLNWISSNKKEAVESNGITVCITGKLRDYKNRSEASAYLSSLGFRCTDSVTQKTNVLISEEDKVSSKHEKAKKLNIPILTIEQLIERYK